MKIYRINGSHVIATTMSEAISLWRDKRWADNHYEGGYAHNVEAVDAILNSRITNKIDPSKVVCVDDYPITQERTRESVAETKRVLRSIRDTYLRRE